MSSTFARGMVTLRPDESRTSSTLALEPDSSTCGSCGSQGIAVVMVQAAVDVPPSAPRRPALTVDDVLSAHDVLRDYTGNVDGLFSAGTSRAR